VEFWEKAVKPPTAFSQNISLGVATSYVFTKSLLERDSAKNTAPRRKADSFGENRAVVRAIFSKTQLIQMFRIKL
jgi:hypothetical protein